MEEKLEYYVCFDGCRRTKYACVDANEAEESSNISLGRRVIQFCKRQKDEGKLSRFCTVLS